MMMKYVASKSNLALAMSHKNLNIILEMYSVSKIEDYQKLGP